MQADIFIDPKQRRKDYRTISGCCGRREGTLTPSGSGQGCASGSDTLGSQPPTPAVNPSVPTPQPHQVCQALSPSLHWLWFFLDVLPALPARTEGLSLLPLLPKPLPLIWSPCFPGPYRSYQCLPLQHSWNLSSPLYSHCSCLRSSGKVEQWLKAQVQRQPQV